MLIAAEWFNCAARHVSVLCRYIEKIKYRFRMVLLTHRRCIDSPALDLFDAHVVLDGDIYDVERFVAHAQRERPEVLLMPSVGMAPWCIALAAVRVAPIR